MTGRTAVLLWWIPVGAGGRLVRRTSRLWELAQAAHDGRAPRPIFHAALEIVVDGHRHVIEMAPAWGRASRVDRGVVATGPVGLRCLGRSRLFRYEVRRWQDGDLPDRAWAVGGPLIFGCRGPAARRMLRRVREVPTFTWGRDDARTGDMWNSNSLVSWLLAEAVDGVEDIVPPDGGRAPGWAAGLAVR